MNICLPNNVCPKCQSTDWDWANIGFSNIVQCTDCGHLYPEWVKYFPTADKPLTPLTPKEVKQYNKAQVQDLGDSPL